MDDECNVTLSIQDKNERGFPVSHNEELLQEAMKKSQELTQAGIKEILEVELEVWKKTFDIPYLEEDVDDVPLWARDKLPVLFGCMIENYVMKTLQTAKHEEFMFFKAMINQDGPAEIFKRCGWTDLAELDPAEVERQLDEYFNKLEMEGGQW